MANNFSLITTAGGTVSHKNDGASRNWLPNGILNGMEMSISGGSIYITEGNLIMGGRCVENSATSSFTVPASGTRYLQAVIDNEVLSIVLSTSSATSSEDINLDGSRYSMNLATITNGVITSQCARHARYGGVIYGTAAQPARTDYPSGTLYAQYE